MNIPDDTINSAMNLAGGALAFVAAIIAAVTAILPRESAIAALAQFRAKFLSFVVIASATASLVSVVYFDSLGVGLFFIIICATLRSVEYLRGKNPASRTETFTFVIQIAIVLAFMLLYWVSRVVSVLERHA